jgi:energy-coupling factor transport system substrate-specific component
MALASIISAAPILVLVFGGVTGSGTSIIAATLMASGTNIWAAVMGSDGIFTVIDRIISYGICGLVVKVIPNRTLIKFSCGMNYIKKKAPASESPAPGTGSEEKTE